MKKWLFSCAVMTTAFVVPAYAQQTALSPIVVTATRTSQTVDDSLAPVTVITREDIEKKQVTSIDDLLRGEVGMSVSNNGGTGKNTSIFLRGTNSGHVLVLINGIKIGSATSGSAAFQDIPVDQIDRIEIVRGPMSSLYGSEAIGGVIQIFTRNGDSPTSFSAGAGSHKTHDISAGTSGKGENAWFNVFGSHYGTKGMNACDGKPSPGGAGCFTIEPDKDPYRNTSGSLRAGYNFSKVSNVEVNWLRAEGDNQNDSTSSNNSKTLQDVIGAKLRVNAGDFWLGTLTLGRSRDESDGFRDATFSNRFNTKRENASLQNDFSVTQNQLVTLGVDYQKDRVISTTAYPITSRDNRGYFTQYQGTFGSNEVRASLRQDDNQQFGTHTTGSTAWGYNFESGLKFIASYGTAFRAPTFNELYFPNFGNPNLPPEESRSKEIGFNQKTGWGSWSLNIYETEIDNLIGVDSSAISIQIARIRGLETVLGTKLAGWDINTNLTLISPKNLSEGPNNGNTLPRRTEESLRIDADRPVGRFRFGTTVRVDGHRYDDIGNTRRLGGFTTVDLRVEYAIFKDWLLQARIANLLDKEYETVSFYNQERRNYFFTLRYQPTVTK